MPNEHTPAAAPAPARTRIIALGDELLAGIGDARCLGWLGRAVASEQGASAPLDLFTVALPGETSAQLAERWESDVSARVDARSQAEGALEHRVVIGMGRADVTAGVSLARSRLNLAKVLDGLERQRLTAFVVGPPPSRDAALTRATIELSGAFEDVCSRRRIPFVDTVRPLADHDQWLDDLARSAGDHPGQTGYGLMAWLVLHGGFGEWLAAPAR